MPFGPLDDDLLAAQGAVDRAEAELEKARDARARAMIHAHTRGYSVHTIGQLTGGRKPPSVQRDLRRFNDQHAAPRPSTAPFT